MTVREPVFRVTFSQGALVHQLFARFISEETMEGFIEISDFVIFEEIDAATHKLFGNVIRTYIPLHTIIRIDEMLSLEGMTLQERENTQQDNNNIWLFPSKN